MPRLVQLVAVCFAIVMAGAPTWLAELAGDDCAEVCASDEAAGGCEEQGCADCSIVCSSCPRPHTLLPHTAAAAPMAMVTFLEDAVPPSERVPVGPPPRGVFHPPRVG